MKNEKLNKTCETSYNDIREIHRPREYCDEALSESFSLCVIYKQNEKNNNEKKKKENIWS